MGVRRRRLPASLAILGALVAFAALVPAAGAAPSCAEGPETQDNTIVGTPCSDTIRLPRSVTTVHGEGGDDTLYGQRGNDRLFGGPGDDRLYGGIGDDRVRGGPDDDLLSGGFGADSLDGEAGNDLARGDATIDFLGDGGGGIDTISFATGATPGFPNAGPFFDEAGFPPTGEGRGVFVDLGSNFANDGQAPSGGGVDNPLEPATTFGAFEVVVGTAFPDYIVGTTGNESFYGGGGADLIDGDGGADTAVGGADGDSCVDVDTHDCESSDGEIAMRDSSTISVGVMPAGSRDALYLAGSDQDDVVTATFTGTNPPPTGTVTFLLGPGSDGTFDTSPGGAGGCDPPVGGSVVCPVDVPPDSIVLAGLGGDDVLSASNLPEATSVVLLGGVDDDALTGGATEDAVIDGAGNDTASAGERDDAVPNNGGTDDLNAGAGEDLFVSNAVCDGDSLDGGADRDNANWANFSSGVVIDMTQQRAGLVGPAGQPNCPSGSLTILQGIEDIEGTSLGDNLVGDAGPNQLLGRAGPDNYLAGAGDDHILANSDTASIVDSDPTIDCGEGFDTALIDFAAVAQDGPPVACESVEERSGNSFRPPDTPPDPNPEPDPPPAGTSSPPPVPPPPLARDRTAPRTRIDKRPAKVVRTARSRRKVVFRFGASEPSSFRCKLDRRAMSRCGARRAFWVSPGRHRLRVVAIDAAGNRDLTPARYSFRVRRR